MIDVATQKPVKVKMAIVSGPYLDISMAQLDKVRAVLDAAGIKYWVSDSAISVNGAPAMTYVWINREADPDFIQARLDEAA
jgi:hypothetical protein